MAAAEKEGQIEAAQEFVYRISTADEWEDLRNSGYVFGGEFDKTSGFIHLSDLHQVQSTLQNFFLDTKADLYLLQIDAKKLGDGLIYELVDGSNRFPHFYGPSRSFSPLPLSAVTKAEKLVLSAGLHHCNLSPTPQPDRLWRDKLQWGINYNNSVVSGMGSFTCRPQEALLTLEEIAPILRPPRHQILDL